MLPDVQDLADHGTTLTHLIESLEREVDPARREAERAELMKPFDHEWKYAPAAERQNAAARIKATQDERAADALYRLERLVLDVAPTIQPLKAKLQRPPDAEAAWLSRSGQAGMAAGEYFNLYVLDELRQQRLSAELRTASPAAVLERYEEALEDPDDQLHAATIRTVESIHGAHWSGPEPSNADLALVQQLRRRIEQARDARIPDELRQLENVIEEARKRAARARTLHGISPRRPANE